MHAAPCDAERCIEPRHGLKHEDHISSPSATVAAEPCSPAVKACHCTWSHLQERWKQGSPGVGCMQARIEGLSLACVRRGLGSASREGGSGRVGGAYGGIPAPPESSSGAGNFAGFDDGARPSRNACAPPSPVTALLEPCCGLRMQAFLRSQLHDVSCQQRLLGLLTSWRQCAEVPVQYGAQSPAGRTAARPGAPRRPARRRRGRRRARARRSRRAAPCSAAAAPAARWARRSLPRI